MLQNKKIHQMLRGASWLSCGGGLAYQEQHKNYQRLIKNHPDFKILLKSIEQFSDGSFLTICGEAGPTNLPPIEKKIAGKLVEILVKISGHKIAGLLPLEIGQEMIVWEIAYYSGLPVADADLAGGRAVPMVYLTLPFLLGHKLNLNPVVAVNSQGQIKILKHAKNPEAVDNFLDNFSQESGGIVFFLSGVIAVKKIKPYLNLSSYSGLVKVKPVIQGHYQITRIKMLQQEVSLVQKIVLQNDKKSLTVFSQNEYLVVVDNSSNQIIFQAPQIISLADPAAGFGLNSGDLLEGMRVDLIVIEPIKKLNTLSVRKKWENYVKNLFD